MTIVPTSDILIAGRHSPAGIPVDVAESIGRLLIADRLARAVAEKLLEPIETAEAQPALETAAATPTRRTPRKL